MNLVTNSSALRAMILFVIALSGMLLGKPSFAQKDGKDEEPKETITIRIPASKPPVVPNVVATQPTEGPSLDQAMLAKLMERMSALEATVTASSAKEAAREKEVATLRAQNTALTTQVATLKKQHEKKFSSFGLAIAQLRSENVRLANRSASNARSTTALATQTKKSITFVKGSLNSNAKAIAANTSLLHALVPRFNTLEEQKNQLVVAVNDLNAYTIRLAGWVDMPTDEVLAAKLPSVSRRITSIAVESKKLSDNLALFSVGVFITIAIVIAFMCAQAVKFNNLHTYAEGIDAQVDSMRQHFNDQVNKICGSVNDQIDGLHARINRVTNFVPVSEVNRANPFEISDPSPGIDQERLLSPA